jgi:predicted 2-oxoglutarate/Fe(II)-dependent dioxygenase YbiX
MELIEKSILVLDDVMGVTQVSQLLKYANSEKFNRAVTVGEMTTKKKDSHRETKSFPLSRTNDSLSNVHWYNFIANKFKNSILTYQKHFPYFYFNQINNIEILKYENNGYYKYHIDDGFNLNRVLSCILLLNNDYEGGELCFYDQVNKKEITIDKKIGRMILWPSNFLFPHAVKPVTKGTRFSVVIWAS